PRGIDAHNAITRRLAEAFGVPLVDQNALMPPRRGILQRSCPLHCRWFQHIRG
ncbi:MAG: hypothetical protein HC806_02760, partial [Anaerolineae bacterium]|nr:hypothetical protein [Anaerolineae bacterium]